MISYPIEIDGIVTRVLAAGTRGTPIVLIHGMGARADRWVHNLDALAAGGYKAVALDLPGHGFASKSADFPHTVEGYSQFVTAFLDHAGVDEAVLCGTSLGGYVAAAVTTKVPSRVQALVLIGALGLSPAGERARKGMAERLQDTTRAGAEAKLRRTIYDQSLVTEERIVEEMMINASPGAQEALGTLADYVRKSLDRDLVGGDLARLKAAPPVLLVWGQEDKTVPPRVAAEAQKLVPSSRLEMMQEAAHSPYFEQPTDFNGLVLGFLEACL